MAGEQIQENCTKPPRSAWIVMKMFAIRKLRNLFVRKPPRSAWIVMKMFAIRKLRNLFESKSSGCCRV
jgi:hypothetical protein